VTGPLSRKPGFTDSSRVIDDRAAALLLHEGELADTPTATTCLRRWALYKHAADPDVSPACTRSTRAGSNPSIPTIGNESTAAAPPRSGPFPTDRPATFARQLPRLIHSSR
jgi:hypothetical protein